MDMQETKTCTTCKQEKQIDEFYVKIKSTGRRFSWCKTCHVEKTNAYYHQKRQGVPRKEKPVVTHKACTRCHRVFPVGDFPIKSTATGQRHALCRECRSQVHAEYRAARKEHIKQREAKYREDRKELLRENQRKWREEHPERYSEIHSQWKKRNLSSVRASGHRRRANILGVGGRWTAAEWEALKAEYNYTCLMCGRREPEIKVCADHVIPVSLGGPNTIDNIQPLCRSCNSKKHQGIVDLRRRPHDQLKE